MTPKLTIIYAGHLASLWLFDNFFAAKQIAFNATHIRIHGMLGRYKRAVWQFTAYSGMYTFVQMLFMWSSSSANSRFIDFGGSNKAPLMHSTGLWQAHTDIGGKTEMHTIKRIRKRSRLIIKVKSENRNNAYNKPLE